MVSSSRGRWIGRSAAVVIVLIAGLAAPPAGAAPADPEKAEAPAREPVIVFVVRHAEKSANDPRDPDLSEAGKARAEELARVLSGAGVTHLFSTEYKRTRQTLAPLSAASGVEVTVVGAREMGEQLETLKSLPPGSVAVVAGHSNTAPAIVAGLGGRVRGEAPGGEIPDLSEDEYDALFQVILPASGSPAGSEKVRSIELKFGS